MYFFRMSPSKPAANQPRKMISWATIVATQCREAANEAAKSTSNSSHLGESSTTFKLPKDVSVKPGSPPEIILKPGALAKYAAVTVIKKCTSMETTDQGSERASSQGSERANSQGSERATDQGSEMSRGKGSQMTRGQGSETTRGRGSQTVHVKISPVKIKRPSIKVPSPEAMFERADDATPVQDEGSMDARPTKFARVEPYIMEQDGAEPEPHFTFFPLYLQQLGKIIRAVSMFLTGRYYEKKLVITCEYEWLLKRFLSQAHRLDDVLIELDTNVPVFTRHYHGIKRDFCQFYTFEISYRIELIKKSFAAMCPIHGTKIPRCTAPGTVIDSLLRLALFDAHEVYAIFGVGNSEYSFDFPDSD